MASVSSTGIGSGLDVNSIVTQLMAVESKPLTLLQNAKTTLNTQLSAFGQLQSLTASMRDAANALSSVLLWKQTVSSSSDSTAVTASSDSGAAISNYSVAVSQLAASQTLSSKAFASSTAAIGEGTLTIELGSWTGEPTPTGFTAKSGATAVNITIGPDDNTLEKIRDKINGSNAGVTASIVNDASGARLALRSKDTGATNAFRVSVNETNDDGDVNTGLSALAYDATAASPMTRYQSSVDAKATINGIAITSASNKLTGVADGLTLTLQKVTTSNVDVGVKANDDSVKTAITTFTTAFNALANYIRENTKYDSSTKTSATLQGDRTVGSVLSQLRGVINEGSTASSVFTRLSDIGISMKADGTLATDSTKLDNAIANRDELRKVLATDATTTGASGFMDRFRDLGNALLGTDGALTTRQSGIETQIENNDKRQEAMQLRLDATEKRLRAQYQALDTTMANMSGLSNYLTGQLAALANNYNN